MTTERLEMLTQRQRMANAMRNFVDNYTRVIDALHGSEEETKTLYCPSCRQRFHTDGEAQPPYSAIHKYTTVPRNGEGPPPRDGEHIHIHPITREELS